VNWGRVEMKPCVAAVQQAWHRPNEGARLRPTVRAAEWVCWRVVSSRPPDRAPRRPLPADKGPLQHGVAELLPPRQQHQALPLRAPPPREARRCRPRPRDGNHQDRGNPTCESRSTSETSTQRNERSTPQRIRPSYSLRRWFVRSAGRAPTTVPPSPPSCCPGSGEPIAGSAPTIAEVAEELGNVMTAQHIGERRLRAVDRRAGRRGRGPRGGRGRKPKTGKGLPLTTHGQIQKEKETQPLFLPDASIPCNLTLPKM